MKDNKIRLQKHLSECGVASRRKAEELIEQGKVKINGHVAVLGAKVDPKRDKVTVRGKTVTAVSEKVYKAAAEAQQAAQGDAGAAPQDNVYEADFTDVDDNNK